MKILKIAIFLGVFSLLLQGCVSQKIWVKKELQENFEKDYDEFMSQKGVVDNPDFQLEVFFDENEVGQKYEVLTYNEVMPTLPFSIFYRNLWWRKHRLHTFLHHAYCTNLWSHADGFIAEPEIGTIKFFRYKASKKPEFNGIPIFPKNRGLTFGYNIRHSGGGWAEGIGLNASYSIDQDKNCMHNIRHDFGLSLGLINHKEEGKKWTNINYNIRYKWIHSYALDEWASNAFNKTSTLSRLFLEIGPVGYLLLGSHYSGNVSGENFSEGITGFLILGAHAAIKYKFNDKIFFIGGLEKPMFPIKSIFNPMQIISGTEEGYPPTFFLNVQYNLNPQK